MIYVSVCVYVCASSNILDLALWIAVSSYIRGYSPECMLLIFFFILLSISSLVTCCFLHLALIAFGIFFMLLRTLKCIFKGRVIFHCLVVPFLAGSLLVDI